MRKPIIIMLIAVIGSIMAFSVLDLPAAASPSSPASTYLSPEYIELVYEEAGIHNIVTAVLLYWRSYDTLGEATVIFAAGVAVIAILGGD